MTTKQQEQMPDAIWYGRDPQYGTSAYCHSEVKPCHTKYIRADLCAPTDKEKEEWIKAVPHETYEGLKKQFISLKGMLNTMGQLLSFYHKKDYQTGEAHLKSLQESLESERAMNAQLTEELSAITHPSREAQLLEVIRDASIAIQNWGDSPKLEWALKHAAIIEEANK